MDIITWLVVGLIVGFLASHFVDGTGLGMIGDILVGIAGAMIGGFIVREAQLKVPVGGLGGLVIVALMGAVLLLLMIRTIQRLVKR